MKKRIISLVLAAAMAATAFTACGSSTTKSSEKEPVPESDEELHSYNITACLSEDNSYNQILLDGFVAACDDYFTPEGYALSTQIATPDRSTAAIAASVSLKKPDLIYTIGNDMLLSEAAVTETIPIVAAGVVDFQGALRIANTGSDSWDKTTGRNITGVTSRPSIADQVSLLIEATPDLETVGILFSPEDTDAIYQNEILEKYLDQAGIPWKEYSIPASQTAIIDDEEGSRTVLAPTKFVAPSARQGMDNTVVPLGENLLSGINSPASTRTALQSSNWTGGKAPQAAVIEDVPADEDETTASEQTTDSETEEEEPEITTDDLIQQVCDECSVIYIPFGSILTDQIAVISSVAVKNNVSTVGGDTTLGQSTLVTLFSDPFDLGYSAGKKAASILLNGTDITTMKITAGSTDNLVKLYNRNIASQMDLEFPKSFSEIHDFLREYEYGSNH